ncbi:MAG: tRNA glutamyl-Q(34) synthetase GluQRS [Rhodothermales bacterium]
MAALQNTQCIVRGRYAPSPTGLIHLGNARTALVAWLSVRRQGGAFIYRLEDLDPPRIQPGADEAAVEDLRWLGIDWDEGPDIGGPAKPYIQSQRYDRYEEALRTLAERSRIFPCSLSRRDLHNVASAPHHNDAAVAYPPELRPTHLPADWFADFVAGKSNDAALRFLVRPETTCFHDRVYGEQCISVAETSGDFVVKRKDGLYAYQLAVVVDDLAMGITEIVRGRDLLGSTARQVQLIEALGSRAPSYAHLPLLVNEGGEKLSKRDASLTLRALRSEGAEPNQVAGYLAYTLGILDFPEPTPAAALIDRFDWKRLSTEDYTVPRDVVDIIRYQAL